MRQGVGSSLCCFRVSSTSSYNPSFSSDSENPYFGGSRVPDTLQQIPHIWSRRGQPLLGSCFFLSVKSVQMRYSLGTRCAGSRLILPPLGSGPPSSRPVSIKRCQPKVSCLGLLTGPYTFSSVYLDTWSWEDPLLTSPVMMAQSSPAYLT